MKFGKELATWFLKSENLRALIRDEKNKCETNGLSEGAERERGAENVYLKK